MNDRTATLAAPTREAESAQQSGARESTSPSLLTDNRPEAVAQRRQRDAMNNSPQAARQSALQHNINRGAHMVAQRLSPRFNYHINVA